MKISWPVKFFIATLILYLVIFFINPELFSISSRSFFQICLKVIPLLLIIFPIMFLVNYFVRPEKIKKHLGKEAGLKAYLYATIAGILISGPPYILFPMLGEFKKQGASNSVLAIFLYNRNVKIPFIPVMIFYFGLTYTIVISVLIVIFSFINGKILTVIVDSKNYKKLT